MNSENVKTYLYFSDGLIYAFEKRMYVFKMVEMPFPLHQRCCFLLFYFIVFFFFALFYYISWMESQTKFSFSSKRNTAWVPVKNLYCPSLGLTVGRTVQDSLHTNDLPAWAQGSPASLLVAALWDSLMRCGPLRVRKRLQAPSRS